MNGSAPSSSGARVAVLLAEFEGAPFLAEQLASIEAQDHAPLEVWVSRDSDRGEERPILEEYAARFGPDRFHIVQGPGRGSTANFLSLVRNPAIEADWFAFADQDDVWAPDKLSRALAKLRSVPASMPALYGARTRLINADGRELGLSPLYRRPPGFRNALVQNFASGNTMVMNRAVRELLCEVPETGPPYHDWWSYLLVSGAGGHVLFDPRPSLRYRQHAHNVTGMPVSARDHMRRAERLAAGRLRETLAANLTALEAARAWLTAENRVVLDHWRRALEGSLLTRLPALRRSGAYHQTRTGNLALFLAVLLNRL